MINLENTQITNTTIHFTSNAIVRKIDYKFKTTTALPKSKLYMNQLFSDFIFT